MKRRALRICLFMLLGAIVNIAVAWGLSCRQTDVVVYIPPTASEIEWLESYGVDLSGVEVWPSRRAGLGQRYDAFFPQFDDEVHIPKDYWRDQCGWPLLCFYAQSPTEGNATSTYDDYNDYLYVKTRLARVNGAIWLPARPMLWAFAINTAFYAAIFWLPLAAFGYVRRRRRFKRGLCPACAYPVGESAVCTECGKPVTGYPPVRV